MARSGDLPPPDQTTGFLLHDVARLLRRRFDLRAATVGLTRAQWKTLFHLARCEGANQRQLADVLEIEPITLTRILDRLQEKGWVERLSHPRDRRAHRLRLTPAARPMLKRLQALAAETRREAWANIGAEDRDRFARTLRTMKENLLRAQRADAPRRDDGEKHGRDE